MTPTEQDKVEKYRSLLMKEHSNEWDMEKVSTIAHLCPTTEPIARKIANCKNPVCTTCPDNAITLADLITADRKRVALEARIDELKRWQWKTDGHIELSGHDVDDRIAELEAQQEEV